MYPVEGRMAGPDDLWIYGPCVFHRGVLGYGRTVRDSVIVETVAQGERCRVVAPAPAIAGIEVVPVVNLVVHLDIKLVIRRVRHGCVVVVKEFVSIAGLWKEIQHSQTDRVNFVGWNYIGSASLLPAAVKANLRPEDVVRRSAIHVRVVNIIREPREVASSFP